MHRVKQFASRKHPNFSRVAAIVVMAVFSILILSQVAFAKNTYVITDGDRVVVHNTYATDPAEVLDEVGLELGKDDTYTTKESGGVSEIIISRIQMVTVDDGSQTLLIGTYGETVEALLSRLDIQLTDDNRVNHPLDAVTYDGMTIEVVHVTTETLEYVESVDFATTYCYDANLEEGTETVLVEGKAGEIACVAKVTYENGEEVSREVINEDLLTPPVDRVIAQSIDRENKVQEGHRRPYVYGEALPVVNPGSSASDSGDLAEVNPEGGTLTTASGEVLTYSKTISVGGTAYTCEGWGRPGITATGTIARVGAIAVDPRIIPYGTKMYVVSDDGMYNYGYCVAEDCGGLIKGNRIDLYFDTEEECINFGYRRCTVYILE